MDLKKSLHHFLWPLLVGLLAGCSTARSLQEGQYRLAKNKVEILNDDGLNISEITPYIKQQAKPAGPMTYIYSMGGKDNKSGWSRLMHKLGTPPVIYTPEQVEASQENIVRHLEYLGYYDSDVDARVSVNRRNVTVDYRVTLGRQVPIGEIRYNLPERGPLAEYFLRDTVNLLVHKGDYLSEALLERESERSAAVLREAGFFGFNKNYYFFQADTLGRKDAVLEYRIGEYTRNEPETSAREHRQYTIGNIRFAYDNDVKIREKVLRQMNTLVPGEVYRESDVNNTYRRLSALKVFRGINLGMVPREDSTVVDCNINLSRSSIQGFKVNLEASSNSNGLLGISPQLTYYHKNIFRGGEWLNLGFLGNFQFKLDDNIRSNEFGVTGGLSFPKLIAVPPRFVRDTRSGGRTEVNLSYSYQNRPEYTRHVVGSSFGYTGNWGPKTFYQIFPLQLSIVRLTDIDPLFLISLLNNPFLLSAYLDHFDLGSRFSVYYTTDASANPTSSYHYFRFQVDASGNVLSLFNGLMKLDSELCERMILDTPYSQYTRLEASAGRTWRLGRTGRRAIATRIMGGIGFAYGNSTTLPFEKQFYGGGASSLRGWQARGVGPGLSEYIDFFTIPSQTGDLKLEANVEYRFPLFWKLNGAAFLDAGNVWLLNGDDLGDGAFRWDTLGDSIAADWGLGLRLDLNFLLLRIDLGMKLHDPVREGAYKWVGPRQWFNRDSYAVHFGVGYPF